MSKLKKLPDGSWIIPSYIKYIEVATREEIPGFGTTQYIGLTNKAINFINQMRLLKNIEDDLEFQLIEENFEEGMFREKIPLYTFKDKDGVIYYEKLQIAPWSSGPMIFTYLTTSYGGKFFLWVEDVKLKDQNMEFNKIEGIYYI